MVPQRFWSISEHCQNLNIWTPSIDPEAKKPVMVWFHGGGFFGGCSTQLYSYEGWEMSHNYDVVIVTVNHRLNMLGFLDLSELGEEYRNSGNLGMADLVEALRWVKRNITAFGGDPDNVTIYGQSGGGGKVSTLMQMPSCRRTLPSGNHSERCDALRASWRRQGAFQKNRTEDGKKSEPEPG